MANSNVYEIVKVVLELLIKLAPVVQDVAKAWADSADDIIKLVQKDHRIDGTDTDQALAADKQTEDNM